mgnify:CR=1 FL=1
MSISEIILGNQIIVVSIGIAFLIMLMAVVLALLPRLRRIATAVKQARAARQSHAPAKRRRRANEDELLEDTALANSGIFEAAVTPDAGGQPTPAKIHVISASGSLPIAGAKAIPAGGTVPTPAPAVPPAVEASQSQSQDQPVSDAMSDILSSVFVDEEANARYQVLLQGVNDIAAADLAAWCENVAAQLRARSAASLVS